MANPLGLVLVHELLTKLPLTTAITVTLLEIGGISNKGLDISHVSACDILNLPCTNGWVRGIHNPTLLVNPKTKALDDDITKTQLDQMEWLFQQRNCAYRERLLSTTTTVTAND
jgi:hypothetical protein